MSSSPHTSPASSQADLQKSLSREIRDNSWQFDSKRIAKMLSATCNAPEDEFVDSTYQELQKKGRLDWPTDKQEQKWYPSIAAFLNNCVDVCHDALDRSKPAAARDFRWYGRLNFIVCDKTTVDGIDGASPVKLRLVGGLDLKPGERVAWSPQDSHTKQVLLPVEVKGEWPRMVFQAATYARCLFSASPSRHFAIVLGFCHTTTELRFLIFHHSGLTASRSFSVRNEAGKKEILRIFLSILGWKSAKDAGFLGFCNDFEMSLLRHEHDQDGVVSRVVEVLHDGLCVQGRASRALLVDYPTSKGEKSEPCVPALDPTVQTQKRQAESNQAQTKQGDQDAQTSIKLAYGPRHYSVKRPSTSTLHWSSDLESDTGKSDRAYAVVKHSWCEEKRREVEADLLTKCKDDFGTPNHHYSFCPTDAKRGPVSTARSLPVEGELLEEFHWKIRNDSQVPSHPQSRTLWIHVSKLVGRSLVQSRTPWDLHVAIGHGMLGWLSMLLKGFLHRDISIGNVLMLDPPVTTKPFESETPAVEQLIARLSLEDDDQRIAHRNELAQHAELLTQTVKEIGPLDKCHGFVIDGDMAARLEGYFTSRETEARSGTYEFMSADLLGTLRSSDLYLHSPIDDLESFYYTAQWAAAFNDGASGGKHDGNKIQEFRKMIAGSANDRYRARGMVRDDLFPDSAMVSEEYGPFFTRALVILSPWTQNLVAMSRDWRRVMDRIRALDDRDREEHLARNFPIFAYRGVEEYFQLLHQHRMSLQGTA
ncbi:hypothetical protein BDM02DRAFT_3190360 [Thelephora ganbajun]|uniref:Uncharacterized protein n=1 Tax=Thelephora ganbajun TaxID=370292 RepID=A0ACB6Z4W5_THEGA|nr:hypothetical protein BDM02DRAFT_3190360 [Thelephora ganbajun]